MNLIKDKIVTFCIKDIHKEEFHSTLLEDRFISFLIRQIKASAKDKNIIEITKLIENLENDIYPNNSFSKHKFCSNAKNNPKGREMTRFSNFLDLQLKEIVERQNALEKQILTFKSNNDINNLNNLINEKNCEIFPNPENTYNDNYYNNKNNQSFSNLNNNYNDNISYSIIKESNHNFYSNIDINPNSNNININNQNANYINIDIDKNFKEITLNNANSINNINLNNKNNYHISKNIISNFNKNNENYPTIDELVNYIETNDNENKKKKNKKKIKNSKKINSQKNPSPSILNSIKNDNNKRIIDDSIVENFKIKLYNQSEMSYQIRKIKPNLSINWLKSINNN
jgi:hypothetical protein